MNKTLSNAQTMPSTMSSTTSKGNLAIQSINTNETTGCRHIILTTYQSQTLNNSNYTSHGKKKKSPCDPIRSQEDIMRIKRYFLTHGRTPQLRLRNHALFVLGISIGVRGGDLLRLRISDVLGQDGEILDEIRLFESKTRKSIYPFINDMAKEALTSYLDSLPKFSYNDMLFSRFGNASESMTTDNLYKMMDKVKTELDLPYHLGSHSLRKTFAYWTIKLHPNDVGTMVNLQEMLNHSSMKTTLHYAGQTKDKLKPMYYDLNSMFTEQEQPMPIVSNDKTEQIYALINAILSDEEVED